MWLVKERYILIIKIMIIKIMIESIAYAYHMNQRNHWICHPKLVP